MWKISVQRDRPHMAIWRMRTACWIHTHTHTHTLKLCNTYWFSTATMVSRTRLIVRIHIHWLPLLLYVKYWNRYSALLESISNNSRICSIFSLLNPAVQLHAHAVTARYEHDSLYPKYWATNYPAVYRSMQLFYSGRNWANSMQPQPQRLMRRF
jgi:hypothetical protein